MHAEEKQKKKQIDTKTWKNIYEIFKLYFAVSTIEPILLLGIVVSLEGCPHDLFIMSQHG